MRIFDRAANRPVSRPDRVCAPHSLYVGRFAGRRTGEHERRIHEWAGAQQVRAGPIEVIGLEEVVRKVRVAAERKQYRDNPALVAVKVLAEAEASP